MRSMIYVHKWNNSRNNLAFAVAFAALAASALFPAPAFAGSQTFSTPGTYTFTVPNYKTLTVTVDGAGGASNGTSNRCTGSVMLPSSDANPGSDSLFGASIVGSGGRGAHFSGSPREMNSTGAPGVASGGDTNTTGGGAPGGHSTVTPPNGCWTTPADGGAGGRAVKSYASGALAAGAGMSVVVGAGGVANPDYNSSYGSVSGSDGSVTITWTSPNCSTSADLSSDSYGFRVLANLVNRLINKFGFNFCISNSSGLNYFVPANTSAELQSFYNAIPRLSGVSQQAP